MTTQYLGKILWYTIAGTRASLTDMRGWFEELRLNPEYLPRVILPIDAFRVATSNTRLEYRVDEDVMAELSLEEVGADRDVVVRNIVRKYRDRRKRALKYDPQIGTVKFFRAARRKGVRNIGGERVIFEITARLSAEEKAVVQELTQLVETRYHAARASLQPQALRGVIRQMVVDLNAILVRSAGGVYFVHTSKLEALDHVEALVNRLGGDCFMHSLPLVDTERQRRMLAGAWDSNVVEECRSIRNEVETLVERAPIAPAAFARTQQRFEIINERTEEWVDLLDLPQDRSVEALEGTLISLQDAARHLALPGRSQA